MDEETSEPPLSSKPRLEFYAPNSPELKTIEIRSFPFTIGRAAEADLQLNSTSISRAHAQLSVEAGRFHVRDLNSTNGTKVNGQPIADASLSDGDSIGLANIELTFLVKSAGRLERMATQPLVTAGTPAPVEALSDRVLASRTAYEALFWQTIPVEAQTVSDVAQGEAFATIYRVGPTLQPTLFACEQGGAAAVHNNVHLMAWLNAAEQHEPTAGGRVLFRLPTPAIPGRAVADALDTVSMSFPPTEKLGMVVGCDWVVKEPLAADTCHRLRRAGRLVAFEASSGSPACLDAINLVPPDLLFLSPEHVGGIQVNQRNRQIVKTILASCGELGVEVVVPTCDEADLQFCRDAGVRLQSLPNPSEVVSVAHGAPAVAEPAAPLEPAAV